jgi:hypothetical protein
MEGRGGLVGNAKFLAFYVFGPFGLPEGNPARTYRDIEPTPVLGTWRLRECGAAN